MDMRATIAPPKYEGIKNTKGAGGRRFLDGWSADCSFFAEATRPGAEVTRSVRGPRGSALRLRWKRLQPRDMLARLRGHPAGHKFLEGLSNATSEVLLLRLEYGVHRAGVAKYRIGSDPTIVAVTLSCVIDLA